MDQLGARPEAKRRPADLRVVAALGLSGRRPLDNGCAQRLQQRRERAGQLDRRGLVGRADLQRAEARVRPDVPPEARVAVGEPQPDEALDERLPFLIGAEDRWRRRPWQLRQHLGAARDQAGLFAREEGRVRRERKYNRQPREHAFERDHAGLRARHPDVDVQSADRLPPCRDACVFDELEIARVGRNLLRRRQAEGVRPGRGHHKPVLGSRLRRAGPQGGHRLTRLCRGRANAGRKLDHRSEQFHLEHARQVAPLGPLHERRDARRKRKCLGIEDHHLLLDPERPRARLAEVLLDHEGGTLTALPALERLEQLALGLRAERILRQVPEQRDRLADLLACRCP